MVFSSKIYSSFLSLYKLNKELIPIEKKNIDSFPNKLITEIQCSIPKIQQCQLSRDTIAIST